MKRDEQLFFIGLVALVLSLFLFPFVAYLFPAVWLGWEYKLPDFVLNSALWIESTFHTTYAMGLEWFFRLTFLAAVFFGVIAYFMAHHISQKKPDDVEEAESRTVIKISQKTKSNSKETVLLFLKMAVILMLVFIVSDVIQWAISFPSEAT